MFRIVSRRTAWWPVRFGGVTEDGKIVENEVELRFVVLDEDEIVDFFARLEKASDEAAQAREQPAASTSAVSEAVNPSSAAAVLPRMLEIVEDWRNVGNENGGALPFTPDNFLQFLKVPNVAKAIGGAYRDCRAAVPQARAGN